MWGGGGQRLRLYKSQMLTGCGDKLITDDLVSSVLQHNRPLSVKTSASSIVLVLQTQESVFNVRARRQHRPRAGALETMNLLNSFV